MHIIAVISGISILLLFRMLYLLNKNLPYRSEIKQYISILLPVVEIITWMGFVIWFIKHTYKSEDETSLLVLAAFVLFLVIPAWFLLGDFLLGVILKVQQKIEINARIEIDEIKGIVTKTGHFTFDIVTKEGRIDTIPYHKVKSKIISRSSTNMHLEKQLIRFRFATKQNINSLLPHLKATILNSPWAAISIDPIIYDISKENEETVVDVFVFTLKQEHAEMIKEYVSAKLKNEG